MKRKYHAIPVLVYAPVDDYPRAEDVYGAIKIPLDMEAPGLTVFFAEDYRDGLVEIDDEEDDLSSWISTACERI
jgi:hypothetical protein